ncbi:MAG: hypothetical protein QG612_1983, partial [Pseudomonadota bacterium]|nr:hypothetical protein [Pseudomonadota bacterium]
LMAVFLWEPRTRASMTQAQFEHDTMSFRPRQLVFVCLLAVVLGLVFLTVPVHFGYLHGAIGVQSPAQIGMAYAINSLGVISGTLLFGWVIGAKLKVPFQLAIGALIAGAGFVMMEHAHDYTVLTTAGLINGLGCGILLPAMVTWNMRDLPVSRRGMGTGAYQSCQFFGMFINPVLIVALEKELGGARVQAIGLEGLVLTGLGVLALLVGLLHKGRSR